MEVYGQLHVLVTSFSGERALGSHWIRDWVEPRSGLNVEAKRKIPTIAPAGNRNLFVHPIAYSLHPSLIPLKAENIPC
jgi:hypothetical protein